MCRITSKLIRILIVITLTQIANVQAQQSNQLTDGETKIMGNQTSQNFSVEKNTKEGNRMTNEELIERGKRLRKVIDERYAQLVKDKALQRKNDITDVIEQFVPIGSSLTNAESILRAAGFEVLPPGKGYIGQENSEVSAVIGQYAPTPFGKTSVGVYIGLDNHAEGVLIKTIRAGIWVQFS